MEEAKREEGGTCGSASLVRGVLLLQEKWVLLIVHQLLHGPVGFNELCRKAEGVNTTTLSQRLDLLEQAGLVVKTIHSYMPPRTSYELTEAGKALQPVLKAIEAWSERYLPVSVQAHGSAEPGQ
jgi:DNA-binding HxlR family transcriptional regulator